MKVVLIVSLAAHTRVYAKEPEHGGKTLSQWLSTPLRGDVSEEQAEAAILQMGTNSLPFLIQAIQGPRLRSEEVTSELQFSNWMQQVSGRLNALGAFAVLGHLAAPAIPELLRLSKEAAAERHRQSAILALAAMGHDGLLTLMSITVDQTHPEKSYALSQLESTHCEWGTNAYLAVPPLLKCLQDPDPKIVRYAAEFLADLNVQPETVVPALTNAMQSADSEVRASVIYSFRKMGPAGALFAPTLVAALNDPALEVRQIAASLLISNPAAIHVVGTMGEQARPAIPVLIEALKHDSVAAEAADALGNLGFDAPAAISALSRSLKSFTPDVRLASVNALAKFGPKADWAAPDLLAVLHDSHFQIRVAITNALLKIMPEALQANQVTDTRVKNTNPAIFRY